METKILICVGTSGLTAGAAQVADLFEKGLKEKNIPNARVIRVGDRGFFRDVLVDIIAPDGKRITFEFVKPSDVERLIQGHFIDKKDPTDLLAGADYQNFFSGQMRIVLENCGEIDPENLDEYLENHGYQGLKKALSLSPAQVIDEIKASGLRGRGGAGFPTGNKWEFCFKAQGDQKFVVCNADEGDPGAFMDRSVLEGDPHGLIEGMTIAAYSIGADKGYVYCRAEYPLAIKRLEKAIKQAEEAGFLGAKIQGTDFNFQLFIKEGAGAFVCGEETALLASIEGQRGTPRTRPPFPAQAGLFGKPTLINNVETFANIRHIIRRGANWYSKIGTQDSRGTKVFALAGKIKNTGLVEVPMGTTIRTLVFDMGGGMLDRKSKIKGVQLGGPSGGCLPEELLDTPIDYGQITKTGAIMGSGGMIVVDDKTCMVDMARFFLEFTVAESCGKCVPCRVGLKRMLEVLEEITQGKGTEEHLNFLKEMGSSINATALCGLGNTAPNPVLTTMRYYPQEYKAHVNDKKCPALVCTPMIEFVVDSEKCIKCGMCKKACPTDAIIWEKGKAAFIDLEKCVKCKSCIAVCPAWAIR